MCVRVLVDASQPVCRGRVITLDDDKKLLVSFKYERLPNICYWCGCFSHNDQDYEIWIDSEGSLVESDREYGPWLRASPMIGTRKSVVAISSFYTKKGGAIPGQRKSCEPGKLTASRVALVKLRTNMERVKHGNSLSFSNSEDTFLTDNHKVDSNQSNSDLVQIINSENQFENHIEDIDRELRKFDLPTKRVKPISYPQVATQFPYQIRIPLFVHSPLIPLKFLIRSYQHLLSP